MSLHVITSPSQRILRKSILALALMLAGRLAWAGTTYYVSASGEDAATGLSETEAFATLAKAIATANADPATEAVVVLSDLVLAAPVEITGPYVLKGATSDPADTMISAVAKPAVTPLVKVSDAGAVVSSLTLSGGTASKTSGGNLWLNGGGTVTNCLIRKAKGSNGYGGASGATTALSPIASSRTDNSPRTAWASGSISMGKEPSSPIRSSGTTR